MSVNRIKLALPQEEYSALLKVASVALRNPEQQAHYILRRFLVDSGALTERLKGAHRYDQ